MKVLSISKIQEENILRSPSRIVTDEDFSNDNLNWETYSSTMVMVYDYQPYR